MKYRSQKLDCGNSLQLELPLPSFFRVDDILNFHARDSEAIAESVKGRIVSKGVTWCGQPACLTLTFNEGSVNAILKTQAEIDESAFKLFGATVDRMLGLSQDTDKFEQKFCKHPELGNLIKRQKGLRIPVSATPFEALTWAIIGQQISVRAAVAIRRRLIICAGTRHCSGLYCYPDALRLFNLSLSELRNNGLSASKANTLLTVSRLIVNKELNVDLNEINHSSIALLQSQLLKVKGIGSWTVNYTLLRGYGWLDGSLHGDVAVRRGLQNLLSSPKPFTAKETEDWLSEFSPWRSLVAAHLWSCA